MSLFHSRRYQNTWKNYFQSIAMVACSTRTVLDYKIHQKLGLSQDRLFPLLNSVDIWSALVVKSRNGICFVTKKQGAENHINFLIDCGYDLRSANELDKPEIYSLAESENFLPNEKRFFIGVEVYSPKVKEAIEYYNPNFSITVRLKRTEEFLIINEVTKTGINGPIARILVSLSRDNANLAHVDILGLGASRQSGRYKELVNEIIAKTFNSLYPLTNVSELEPYLKDELLLSTLNKSFVKPRRVQFIFAD